jgi:hypothetical protein
MSRIARRPRALALLLPVLWLAAACGPNQPTRWEKAEQESRDTKAAVAKEAVAGGEFNKFFPKVKDDWDLVYKQEKQGFSQASLKKGGKEVALLSVFDTLSNPEARARYEKSTDAFAGFPIAPIGEQGTGLLVADRFVVQVRSMDDSFAKEDREAWLAKFDLAGISKLN